MKSRKSSFVWPSLRGHSLNPDLYSFQKNNYIKNSHFKNCVFLSFEYFFFKNGAFLGQKSLFIWGNMALSRLNKLVGVRKFFNFSFEWILSSRLSHDWFTRVYPVRIIRKSDDGARFSIFGRTFQFNDPKCHTHCDEIHNPIYGGTNCYPRQVWIHGFVRFQLVAWS